MLIEMGGKYVYRNGREARVLCTDADGRDCVITYDIYNNSVHRHQSDGRFVDENNDSPRDILPAPSPPRYEPFTDADRDKVRGRWLIHNVDGSQICVTNFSHSQAAGRSWQNLLNFYTFMDDGTPCGKLAQRS